MTVRGQIRGRLTKASSEITLFDIYRAVKNAEKASLFDIHPNPNPLCPVGCNIKSALEAPLTEAQQAMENALNERTLQDIIESIVEMYKESNGGNIYEGI